MFARVGYFQAIFGHEQFYSVLLSGVPGDNAQSLWCKQHDAPRDLNLGPIDVVHQLVCWALQSGDVAHTLTIRWGWKRVYLDRMLNNPIQIKFPWGCACNIQRLWLCGDLHRRSQASLENNGATLITGFLSKKADKCLHSAANWIVFNLRSYWHSFDYLKRFLSHKWNH